MCLSEIYSDTVFCFFVTSSYCGNHAYRSCSCCSCSTTKYARNSIKKFKAVYAEGQHEKERYSRANVILIVLVFAGVFKQWGLSDQKPTHACVIYVTRNIFCCCLFFEYAAVLHLWVSYFLARCRTKAEDMAIYLKM